MELSRVKARIKALAEKTGVLSTQHAANIYGLLTSIPHEQDLLGFAG
jgi:hypothetical protein